MIMCHATRSYAMICDAMRYIAAKCYVHMTHALLCCETMCYEMAPYAMLCSAVLRDATPRYA
eukprot:4896291-Pyramimonas_sp.AAC.1